MTRRWSSHSLTSPAAVPDVAPGPSPAAPLSSPPLFLLLLLPVKRSDQITSVAEGACGDARGWSGCAPAAASSATVAITAASVAVGCTVHMRMHRHMIAAFSDVRT